VRHLQSVAKFEGLEICAGDAAHHGEGNGFLVVMAGQRRGPRRCPQGAVLAPEIQLIAGAQHRTKAVEGFRTHAGDPGMLARGIRAQIHRRQQRRPGDACLCIGLFNACDRGGQIIITALRLRNQIIQGGRAEAVPPCRARPYPLIFIGRRFAPGGRRRNVRPLKGRTHAAGAERQKHAGTNRPCG
jgi:hypothetical protein